MSIVFIRGGIEFVGEGMVLIEPIVPTVPAGQTWAVAPVVASPEMHSNEARKGRVGGDIIEGFGREGLEDWEISQNSGLNEW